MFKKMYLSKLLSLILVAQLMFSSVFAIGTADIKIGRANNTSNLDDGGTFLQKAYCANANYYYNVLPDVSNGQRVSTVMRYISGDINVNTSNFHYNSFFDTNGWTTFAGSPLIVTSTTPSFELLEAGYSYVKMERYTEDANKVIASSSNFNFGDFNLTNAFGKTGTNLKLHYNVPNNDALDSSTNFGALNQGVRLPSSYNYLVDVKFIPEPCTPDNQYPLGDSYSLSGLIIERAAIDSGVSFLLNEPNGVFEAYSYTSGDPRENVVEDPLTTAYSATLSSNQWGINTGSVTITLTYTGVTRGLQDQRGVGTAITKVFSGSDLDFAYGARSWNRNYLGANISVKTGVLDAMLDFRKETPASITYSAYDWAAPLPYVVNTSATRSGANHFTQTYSNFNAGISNTPTAYLAKDAGDTEVSIVVSSNTRVGSTGQQISGSHSQFHFAFTDNRAGIASGSIKVTVQVFTATNTVENSYQTNLTTPTWSYVYSGSELSLFASGGIADYPDYTGFVDLNGERTLITGDRVVVNVYAEDFVGNSISQTGSFDMQDYPPKPSNTTVNIQLENHFQLTDDKVSPIQTLILSGYYSAYETSYGSLSGFLYNGIYSAELTGLNAGSTLSGVFLENGVLTGYANVDTGLSAIKTFDFNIYAQNIYNQTGLVTLHISVEPGCADAEGCGTRIMMYTGLSLFDAQNSLTGTWYNGWFVKIKGGDRPVLTGTADTAILYCGGSGGITSIDISNLDGNINDPYDSLYTFSGSTLYVSGDNVYGMSGIIYQSGVIYVIRDLTGAIDYDTGAYIGGGQINWTMSDSITGTITLTGGYITGDNLGIFTLSGTELGGGRRIYTYNTTINTGFSILVENRWNTSGDTVEPDFYQTSTLDFNVSWIDRQMPIITTGDACQSPHTGTIYITSTETGYGENFTGNMTYLTGDDDLFIINAILTGTDYTGSLFGTNESSGAWIYDINANSGSRAITGNVTFIGNRSGYIHFQDKAGNTGYVFVETTCINGPSVNAYAIPGYRDENNYELTGTLQIYIIGEGGTGEYYNSYTGSLNNSGIGVYELVRPLYGQTIGVVLQTSMHLPSLGFTGVFMETGINNEEVGTGLVFDFTTWTGRDIPNLTSGWFDAVDLSSIGLGVRSLLVPGDVYKENLGMTGSIINAFDMVMINANLTLNDSTDENWDLDFDRKGGIISSFEQAVIIQNLQREGRDLDLDKFGGLVYTGF